MSCACASCGKEIIASEQYKFYLSESPDSMAHESCWADYISYLVENDELHLDDDGYPEH